MDKLAEQFGALGNWQKIDEKFDETIVKQTNDASCVATVGEMLADFYGCCPIMSVAHNHGRNCRKRLNRNCMKRM